MFIVQTNTAREVAGAISRRWPICTARGRYDRMSDGVRTLTGQGPHSVQEFVRNNAAKSAASVKAS
jgi:hypothetical protein